MCPESFEYVKIRGRRRKKSRFLDSDYINKVRILPEPGAEKESKQISQRERDLQTTLTKLTTARAVNKQAAKKIVNYLKRFY